MLYMSTSPVREHVPSFPRRIAVVAAAVALGCALATAPMAIGEDHPATSARTEQLLEARAQVAAVNEYAVEHAPPAVGASCRDTLDVPGLGATCATPDGMLRVEQADGTSHPVHGLDAPPVAASTFATGSQAAVDGADASDITCAAPGTRAYVLVYARPSDVASRFSSVAPRLRAETYRLSAYVDAESQSVDPRKGKRLPLRCDGSEPVVLNATLGALTNGAASFRNIVDGLRELGYEYNGGGSGADRYLVYYDSTSPAGAAGTGHVFTADATAGADNKNNLGGLYAVQYNFAQGGDAPRWDVMLHEVAHTMGAVSDAAPHSTGDAQLQQPGGHCNDGQDVMCYTDGGPRSSYAPDVCARKLLDCNRDDYFNPSPPAGSYLATHWNTASTANLWLEHRTTGDQIGPTAPGVPTQTGASNAAVGVAWAPATDDTGIASYVVSVRSPGGAWRVAVSTTRRTASVGGLTPSASWEIGVTARDAAGNVGPMATTAAATNDRPDTTAPAAPTGFRLIKLTAATATFAWNDATDDVAVADFELRAVDPTATNPRARAPRSAGTTVETTITVPVTGIKPGTTRRFELVARDGAANVSRARSPRSRARVTPSDRRCPRSCASRAAPGARSRWRGRLRATTSR